MTDVERSLTAVDLFAGCGGLSAGLVEAGLDVLGAVEIDPSAVRTYSLNFPKASVICADIRDVDVVAFRRSLGLKRKQLDLLTACAPCQGFSRIATRNGGKRVADSRNALVLSVLPFIEEFVPAFVLLENVPAAKTSRHFARVRGHLRRLGYKLADGVLELSNFGLPQRRRRYVLVAGLYSQPELPQPSARKSSVREAIGHLPRPGESGDPLHDVEWHASARVREMIEQIPLDGGSRMDLPEDLVLACHKKVRGFHDVYGRLSWDQPGVTITSGFVNPSKGRFLHPEQNRPLTPREAALLQGFPATFKFVTGQRKYALAQMIGNAVPSSFAKLQALSLFGANSTRKVSCRE